MLIIILKNITTNEIKPAKLSGMRIDANSQYEASKNRTLYELQSSQDLKDMINSGDIIMNNGTTDLSASVAIEILTPFNKDVPTQHVAFKSPTKNWELSIDDLGDLVKVEI